VIEARMGTAPARLLDGRVCMVTGATSGIGAVTARELARLGAEVVVVGRDGGRCAREVERILEAGGRAEALVADLSSQASVRALAERFGRRHGRLDVLVNNAGAYFAHRRFSADGIEMNLALNHLSAFMLTLLLLDRLAASASARVVNVSSSAHEGRRIDFDDLEGEHHYERLEAYGRSKLANLLFTYELARRLVGMRATANALHPGTVATNLGADRGWLMVTVRKLVRRGMLSPEQGAKTTVHLASSPELEGVSGRYFRDCREAHSSDASHDRAAASRLWAMSEHLTGLRWSPAPEWILPPRPATAIFPAARESFSE
jgi:NAD(P)-dependent dehydrogenase (short-subunit alcohol dehydrogenase family)